MTQATRKETSSSSPNKSGKFNVGDKVRISVSPEELKVLQENHGGYNPEMLSFIDLVGSVHRVTTSGNIRVQYPGQPESNFRWTVNPAALTTVDSTLLVGDRVKLVEDVNLLAKVQQGHGGLCPDMDQALGKVGQVLKVYSDGDVRVRILGREWTFNPAALSKTEAVVSTAVVEHVPRAVPVQAPYNKMVGNEEEFLLRACAKGDVFTVREVLSNLSNLSSAPNATVIRSSLQIACQSGHLEIVNELVKTFPCEIAAKHQGKTLLQVAGHSGQIEILNFLLVNKPEECKHLLNEPDEEGDTPLHYGVYSKKPQSIQTLLNFGADVNAVNAKGSSSLHLAVLVQDLPSVEMLLSDPRIDTALQDHYGDTAFHEAIVKGSPEIIDVLLDKSKDESDNQLLISNQRGFNCFQYAALKGNLYAIEKMAHKFPHLACIPKADGFTPLSVASLNGHHEVVRYLLDIEHTNLLALNHRGQNCLHCAVDQGHVEVIELLLEASEKQDLLAQLLNCSDVEGDTPLHITLRREGEPSSKARQEDWSQGFQSIFEAVSQSGLVSQIQLLPISVAALLISKGRAAFNVKNKAGLKPLDYIIDPHVRNWLKQQGFEDHHHASEQGPSVSYNNLECQICCEKMKGKDKGPVKFEPCGHVIVCSECCARMKRCLECKAPIEKKVVVKDDIDASDTDDEVKSLKTLKLRDLEAKNRDWEEHYLCSICMERKKNVAFLCGHGACDICVETLRRCHMCRGSISQKINLY